MGDVELSAIVWELCEEQNGTTKYPERLYRGRAGILAAVICFGADRIQAISLVGNYSCPF
jgi:hypothetical protein